MKSNLSSIISSYQIILIDFFAEWCGPCKLMGPILKEVKAELGAEIKIVKIDIDKNPEVAVKYNVRSVPTLLLFKNGIQFGRHSGVLQKQDVISFIRSHSK